MKFIEYVIILLIQAKGVKTWGPVFKGTRIPLYVVLDLLSEGMAAKEIIKAYPDLDKDDIKAAMLFASDAAKHITEIEFASADR